MPHLTFNNCNFAKDENKLKNLNEELGNAVGSPCDWFTFTFLSEENRTYQLGKDISKDIAFVEVKWFSRPQNLKENVSNIIAEFLKSFDKNDREIVITFVELTKESYFEY